MSASKTKTVVRRAAGMEDYYLELFLRQRTYEIYHKTKDGQTISLSALSDEHLKRIIAMKERNAVADIESHIENCAILDKDYHE